MFKLAPELTVISRFGVGVDNIDISKAKEFGIKVTNCKGINSNACLLYTSHQGCDCRCTAKPRYGNRRKYAGEDKSIPAIDFSGSNEFSD